MTGNAEQATDRQQRRRWTVAVVTLAVNLGSFAYLVLIARSASPAIFGALAALAGIALLFEVPANALQVALGPRRGPRARRTSSAGGGRGTTRRRLPARCGGLRRPACPFASSRAVPPPAIDHERSPAGGLRPARGDQRRAQGCPGRPGTAAATGNGPDRRHGGADRRGRCAGPAWRRPRRRLRSHGLGRSRHRRHSPDRPARDAQASRSAGKWPGYRREPVLRRPVPGSPWRQRASKARRSSEAQHQRTLCGTTPNWPAPRSPGTGSLRRSTSSLARHWLGREVSGWYSAAATIAQIALLAPGAIAALTFPRLVGSDIPRLVGPDSRPNQRLMFALGSAAVALTGFLAAVVVCVFAHGTVKRVVRAALLAGCERGGPAQLQ